MDIYKFDFDKKNLNKENELKTNSILLLGKFNIFHIGHYELFLKAKELKKQNNFEIKIGILIIIDLNKQQILTIKNLLYNLALIGFDYAIVAIFDEKFKSIRAKDFIDHLINKYKCSFFVVGEDFEFGFGREWNAKNLKNYFHKTFILPLIKENNQKISTNKIKQMIDFGELNIVSKLLIKPLTYDIELNDKKFFNFDLNLIKPHYGLYYGLLLFNNNWYQCIIHFSMNFKNVFVSFLNNLNLDELPSHLITKIKIINIARIIINSRFDNITKNDFEDAICFFNKNKLIS